VVGALFDPHPPATIATIATVDSNATLQYPRFMASPEHR
jgi:hypothetical protein